MGLANLLLSPYNPPQLATIHIQNIALGDWAEWLSTGTTTKRRQKRHTDGVEPVQVQQALVSATLLGAPWSVLEPMSPE